MDLKVYNLTTFIIKCPLLLYDLFGFSRVLLLHVSLLLITVLVFFYCSKFNALYNIHVFSTIFFKKDWGMCIQATVIAQYYLFLRILCTSSCISGKTSIGS